jgi:threonine dehydrogenase-like Zn-dependent dehydrogenase
MKALLLEDVERLAVERIPDPKVSPHEVLISVKAVGVCGTDLHIYQGHGNWAFDAQGRAIPLTEKPQILGHEFSGEVLEAGREVKDLIPGDRILCDQGRNCVSQGRRPRCEYCLSGDSHQCRYYAEHGITGLQGAMADYIAMPAVNCLKVPEDMSLELGALVEPVGCVIHSSDWVERAHGRYTFDGAEPIRNILIFGAGPAGLLFLQYLRNVKQFAGLILVADLREQNLRLVEAFGGTPLNAVREDLLIAVNDHTQGERAHLVIDACGSAEIFRQIPGMLRKQGTLLIYGGGHKGHDFSILDPILFLEPTLVASIGASGGFDAGGRSTTYRRALELVSSGKVKVAPFVTHRYDGLEKIHWAFEQDFQRQDYIKGVLNLSRGIDSPQSTAETGGRVG